MPSQMRPKASAINGSPTRNTLMALKTATYLYLHSNDLPLLVGTTIR